MNPSDFAQRIADKLVAQLKEGTAPWQKPWAEGLSLAHTTQRREIDIEELTFWR